MYGTVIPIQSRHGVSKMMGTGFFYTKFGNLDSNGYHEMTGMWLVTCRHVVILRDNDGKECLADKIEFPIRKINEDGSIGWPIISINSDELRSRLKIHQNPDVDIVVIDVFDRIMKLIKRISDGGSSIIRFDGIKNLYLPENSKIRVHGGDDVIVIGFPRGMYDDVNKYPVLKSGMIASYWGQCFRGEPMFLLDAKLLEGSSGSPVVSKPSRFAIENRKLMWNETPQYVFLGVYSGSYAPQDIKDDDMYDKFGFGAVWYSYLIPEIIDDGAELPYFDDQ